MEEKLNLPRARRFSVGNGYHHALPLLKTFSVHLTDRLPVSRGTVRQQNFSAELGSVKSRVDCVDESPLLYLGPVFKTEFHWKVHINRKNTIGP